MFCHDYLMTCSHIHAWSGQAAASPAMSPAGVIGYGGHPAEAQFIGKTSVSEHGNSCSVGSALPRAAKFAAEAE